MRIEQSGTSPAAARPGSPANSLPLVRLTLIVTAFAAFVFAARAWLIHQWGSSVPFLDQWSDVPLLRSWSSNTLGLSDLFATHNEHRIVLTRLANLALFTATGQWNPAHQLVLNAALHAVGAALMAGLFLRQLDRAARILLLIAATLLFGSPAGWQNALWGFQSQVYFGNLLAVLAFALIVFPTRPAIRPLAALPLTLAVFANAGGAIAAAVAVLLAIPRTRSRAEIRLGLILIAVLLLALMLHLSPPAHAALRAQTPLQFLAVFLRCLSWPFVDSPWLWLVVQAPAVAFFVAPRSRRAAWTPAERFALGLVAFAVTHAAAIAYSRAGGLIDARPLSRYQDPLILGAFGQVFLALQVALAAGRRCRLAALIWAAVMVGGLLQLAATNLSLHLPFKRAQDSVHLSQVRSYLQTHDATTLRPRAPFPAPYPDPSHLAALLQDPALGRIWPPAFTATDPIPAPFSNAGWITLCTSLVVWALAWPVSYRPHRAMTSPPRAP